MTYQDPRDQFPGTHAYTRPVTPAYETQAEQRYDHAPVPGSDQPHRQPLVTAPRVNPVLFVGGVLMTGVVVALAVGLVAWVITTLTDRTGIGIALGSDAVTTYAIIGFVTALVAAALWYVLQLITPAPGSFFAWIAGLLVIAAVLIPLLVSTNLATGIATAALHLVIGLPILALVPMVGSQSQRR
ncbi:hypothetical protein HUN08_05940 [Gordonia sp. X0973]|uniref:DUF6069 family protein n=1 Tax=Gordonia sp. X0973 TaxID=2742602 RepID=UPI000F51C44D|nr:DUF6069 family protein [Gordonia sp. X0973]QKT06786.1 hypothetical protein HUN08_05940 [Gordonia sp. X0973]